MVCHGFKLFCSVQFGSGVVRAISDIMRGENVLYTLARKVQVRDRMGMEIRGHGGLALP